MLNVKKYISATINMAVYFEKDLQFAVEVLSQGCNLCYWKV